MIRHAFIFKGQRRAGFSLAELSMGLAMFAVVGGIAIQALNAPTRYIRSQIQVESHKMRGREVLARLENTLQFAKGYEPTARITLAIGSGSTDLVVDNVEGFPDTGRLILSRDSAARELVTYSSLAGIGQGFGDLARGLGCSKAFAHAETARVVLADSASPIADQGTPAAELFDGRAQGRFGPIFYEGLGTGFVFRQPVDPTGGGDYIENGAIRWGATVDDVVTDQGWSRLTYVVVGLVSEAQEQLDINQDGDQTDLFDLGKLQLKSWDASSPNTAIFSQNLLPGVVLQEQCNYGSDLDGDGFEDPIFLWDSARAMLVIRLSLFTRGSQYASDVRQLQTTIFMRNSQAL